MNITVLLYKRWKELYCSLDKDGAEEYDIFNYWLETNNGYYYAKPKSEACMKEAQSLAHKLGKSVVIIDLIE